MWCSRQNARIFFYVGAMLFIVGLGLAVMKMKVAAAIFLCLGIIPLLVGFLITITHVFVEDKMRKKKAENSVKPVKMEDEEEEKVSDSSSQ